MFFKYLNTTARSTSFLFFKTNKQAVDFKICELFEMFFIQVEIFAWQWPIEETECDANNIKTDLHEYWQLIFWTKSP